VGEAEVKVWWLENDNLPRNSLTIRVSGITIRPFMERRPEGLTNGFPQTSGKGSIASHADLWKGRDWVILCALTLLAAALRFYQLGTVPPGFQFDEAYNALDVARVLQGQHPLFLPANAGREVLYTYLQAGLAAVFGLRVTTLRLASALAGIATVPIAYWLLRRLLSRHSRRVALFAALALATSFWHLHFSHYGIRVILMPVLFSGVFGFYWLGSRQRRLWPFLISGLLAGLSVWTHPTGRLVPIVWAGYTIYLACTGGWRLSFKTKPVPFSGADPGHKTNRPLAGLAVAGAAAFLVFLPLGIEFYRHPDYFLGHASEVSVFAQGVAQGSLLLALLRNGLAVLGMFSLQGDLAWIHNLAGRPVFDPLLSIPFWLGLLVWVRRLLRRDDPDRSALALLMIWTLVMLAPSVLSDDAPNFSRTLPALPALFLAVGLGLDAMLDLGSRIARRVRSATRVAPAAGWSLVTAILLVSAGWSLYDYFVRFPKQAEAYYAYDVDKLDAWSFIQPLTQNHQVYLSQLWAEHATLDFLRRGTGVKSLNTTQTLVLPPPGRGAAYVFPAEQRDRAERIAALWPGTAVTQTLDRFGKPLLESVILEAGALDAWPPGLSPSKPSQGAFAGGPSLQGMSMVDGDITLFWRADGPMQQSLTSMLQLIDAQGDKVGLGDKLPGNGSYPTPVWTVGERVIEQYPLTPDPCLGGETVRVVVGWYDQAAGGTRLPLADRTADSVVAGEVRLPLTSRPADQAQPPHVLNQSLPGGLVLAGYGAADKELQAGSPLALDLYWLGGGVAPELPLDLELASVSQAGSGEVFRLWQGALAPAETQWQPDEVLCRRLPLRVPSDASSGSYRLQATVNGQTIRLGDLSLGASTRQYDMPPVSVPISATLGDQVRLRGYDLAQTPQPGGPITVTLTWQAATEPSTSYSVFVHLTNENGEIIAQSDSLPAGGYATDLWLRGEIVSDAHVLQPPAQDNTAVGQGSARHYYLVTGMYDPLTGRRLPIRDANGQAVPDNAIRLGEVSFPAPSP